MYLNKKAVLALFLLTVLGIFLSAEFCTATITKPATPTFTVVEISNPYDVPPFSTTTVDGYTGEETTTSAPGYTVENITTYIKIKNQPFTPYKNSDGVVMNLYYEYRFKGHYADGWSGGDPYNNGYYSQSDLDYTLVVYSNNIPQRGQVDVQVRALIGVVTCVEEWWMIGRPIVQSFSGIRGDWSDIVVVSFNPLSFTVLPSTSTPSTNSPDYSSPAYSDPSTTSDFTGPSSSSPDMPLQDPWPSYMLTIAVVACVVTIPIAIVAYLNNQMEKTKPLTPPTSSTAKRMTDKL
jgi:hypothetical protein